MTKVENPFIINFKMLIYNFKIVGRLRHMEGRTTTEVVYKLINDACLKEKYEAALKT